ncbi:uncharacterized protein EV420DRAFT_73237 [Desarmillaria tabescens]|uniref:Uncharacterized protein n=1 Tax=Armillaria tabescens TaxID=1929756 RepID=A0AA39T7H4_ARMTA|nr:uncharacterized protein EV420DRAFT_73237 [Desarmillaria tabescens]KAK0469871.1 hypothetical protein EV420DRAFT_73237 [Desarmillaria tabescens]
MLTACFLSNSVTHKVAMLGLSVPWVVLPRRLTTWRQLSSTGFPACMTAKLYVPFFYEWLFDVLTLILQTDSTEPIARTPSPVPTEVIEPDPEDIAQTLKRNGIKMRDYAYEATIKPVAETFDALIGISEYEHRLKNTHPTRPHINGKTLHRLLETGYISLEEATTRCHSQDMSALAEYRASPNASYPWRALPLKEEHEVKSWSVEERQTWVAKSQVALAAIASLRCYDRCVARERARLESEEKDRQIIEEAMRLYRERESAEIGAMNKRALDDPEKELSPGKKQKVAHDLPVALPSSTTAASVHAQPSPTPLPSAPDMAAPAPLVASHRRIGSTTTPSGIEPSGPVRPNSSTSLLVARPAAEGLVGRRL